MNKASRLRLGAQDGPTGPTAAVVRPAEAAAPARRRRPRGPRAASNRALRLRRGLGDLPPHKEALVAVTARLIIHLENASDRLYREGELAMDGTPKALLTRVMELARQVRDNIAYLADGVDAGDPFGPVSNG